MKKVAFDISFGIIMAMAPLENVGEISSDEWKNLSGKRRSFGGTPKKDKYLVEDELIESVVNEGKSYELQYSDPEEVDKMRVRLNARVTGRGIRILTDSSKPNSVFIGPTRNQE